MFVFHVSARLTKPGVNYQAVISKADSSDTPAVASILAPTPAAVAIDLIQKVQAAIVAGGLASNLFDVHLHFDNL